MTPETKIKKEITAYLKSLGPKCWFAPYVQNGMGKAGVPDLLVCYRGRFIALEVKTFANKPTAWQAREIEAIRMADGGAYIVYSAAMVQGIIEECNVLFG